MTKYLLILSLIAPCAAEVIVIPKSGPLIRYLQRGGDNPTAARVLTPRGLAFGEPVCEPDTVTAPRCAFSHPFTDGEATSDLAVIRLRFAAVAISQGFITGKESPAQRRAALEKFGAILVALPKDWRYPVEPTERR